MADTDEFADIPTTGPPPRVAGPAFTVRCPPGDNLMLHAAVHRAGPGSVVVVQSGDLDCALAGGNVCAVARRRGVAALVADGLIRDLAEVREMGFPVFARGVIPIPGGKSAVRPLGERVRCGGVSVDAGDVVVADEEGVVVVPRRPPEGGPRRRPGETGAGGGGVPRRVGGGAPDADRQDPRGRRVRGVTSRGCRATGAPGSGATGGRGPRRPGHRLADNRSELRPQASVPASAS